MSSHLTRIVLSVHSKWVSSISLEFTIRLIWWTDHYPRSRRSSFSFTSDKSRPDATAKSCGSGRSYPPRLRYTFRITSSRCQLGREEGVPYYWLPWTGQHSWNSDATARISILERSYWKFNLLGEGWKSEDCIIPRRYPGRLTFVWLGYGNHP